MTIRRQIVTRCPGSDDTPMVKVANRLLETMEFKIGVLIEVTYQRGKITIRRINEQHANNQLQKPSGPVSLSAATSSADVEREGDGYASSRASHSERGSEFVPNVQSYRYILRGHWDTLHPQDSRINCREVSIS